MIRIKSKKKDVKQSKQRMLLEPTIFSLKKETTVFLALKIGAGTSNLFKELWFTGHALSDQTTTFPRRTLVS